MPRFNFDAHSFEIPCPSCGKKAAQTIGWLKANDQFPCPGCGGSIRLDKAEFLKQLAEIERELARLPGEIRIKLG